MSEYESGLGLDSSTVDHAHLDNNAHNSAQNTEQSTGPGAGGAGAGTGAGEQFKMFVGGLSWNTTNEGLHAFFSKFGNIVDHEIIQDKTTGRSRGFGFIQFDSSAAVTAVLDEQERNPFALDGRPIQVKTAVAKDALPIRLRDYRGYDIQHTAPRVLENKLFVAGVPETATSDDLTRAFEPFGHILSCEVMYDKNTNKHRGFGFVTFESSEAATRALSTAIIVGGKTVDLKKAVPRDVIHHAPPPPQPHHPYAYNQNQHRGYSGHHAPPPPLPHHQSHYDYRDRYATPYAQPYPQRGGYDDYYRRDEPDYRRRDRSPPRSSYYSAPPPPPPGSASSHSHAPSASRYERRSRSRSPPRSHASAYPHAANGAYGQPIVSNAGARGPYDRAPSSSSSAPYPYQAHAPHAPPAAPHAPHAPHVPAIPPYHVPPSSSSSSSSSGSSAYYYDAYGQQRRY